jgi:hypothetical protein
MNNQNDPKNPDTAWEEAMSRDFDARVRDLHEAPLDFDSVKGKAGKIKRNRRAAVAGGILGVAAIITPVAVLANGDGDARSREPDFAPQTDETVADPAPTNPDYVLGGRWHQADGDVRQLPDRDYDSAVLWGDQLVATYFDGEVFLIADVIDADGKVVDSFPTTAPVAVNEAGTTIAWINPDTSEVMTAGDDEPVSLGSVDLSAPGEAIAWSVAAITGGPDCLDNDELPACVVYLNSGLGEESRRFDSLGVNENVASGVTKVFDATDDGVVSVINEVTDDLNTCGGLLDRVDGTLRWRTCDYQVQQISPDGAYVAAPPSQYDGLGPSSISVLDTENGEETGRFAPESGFIGQWAWTTDSMLVFTAFDGANWHLMTMNPDGSAITEIGDPVKGDEFDGAFTLVNR